MIKQTISNSSRKKIQLSQVALTAVVIILCVMVLYPFFLMIIKSFKDYTQEIEHPISLAFPLHLENYEVAWAYVKNSIFNSFFVSTTQSILSVLLSAMGAYGFSRYKFRGKNLAYSLAVSLMMVPSVLILTTKYVLVTVTFKLHNNYLGVILPQAAGLVSFGLLLLKGSFDSLPKDLFDAADIDGAGSIRQFTKILLPLSMPMITTLFLMNFMTSWNDYLWPRMMLRDETMYTIPITLQSFTDYFYKLTQYYAPPLAGYVIVSIPLLVLFGFTSKHFIRGMTSGAFKM